MNLVLDSSVTLAWAYGDEITPSVQAVFDDIADGGALVPCLWRLEVGNALLMGAKRGRISPDYRDVVLQKLAQMNIASDSETDIYAWSTTMKLAQSFNLTSYDAAYLELANRKTLPLATLDSALKSAANNLGVRVMGGDKR